MEKKIIFWVLSLSLVAILLPGGRTVDPHPKLPWDVQITPQGKVRVFELTLGKSTLTDARSDFKLQGEVNLFIDPSGKLALEAYFERVFLSGLRADFILVLDAGREELERLYTHGNRIRRTSETTRKVTLSGEDLERAGNFPIKLINYFPYANLSDELVAQRFGQPAQKLTERKTGVTHWIYPQRGLSIALSPEGKDLIQYMPLEEIKALKKRIEESNKTLGGVTGKD